MTPQSRIPPLDGLRGTAIIMVMIFHASAPLLKGGFLGVDIFFVLSGYLITVHLLQEAGSTGKVNLKHFYIRRFLRLMPAFIVLICAFLIAPWALNLPSGTISLYIKEALVSLFYLSNWARAFNIHAPSMLGHTWSLAIEEQFYLIWPFALLLLLRYKHKYSAPAMVLITATLAALCAWCTRAILCAQGATISRLYNGLDTRVDALMVGAALAGGIILIQKHELQSISRSIARVCLLPALTAIIYLSITTDWQEPALYYWKLSLTSLSAAAVIAHLSLSKKGLLTTFFTLKPLVFLGTISYGLYLWHYPIYRVLLLLGMNEGLLLLFYGGSLSLLIASMSYYLLEKPFLKLKAKFR